MKGDRLNDKMTIKEFRARYPRKIAQVEAMAKAVSECRASREIDSAIRAERNRIAEIDEVADLFDPELVYEAKYGDDPCNASELEIRAKMPKNRMRAAKNQVKTLFR